MSSNSKQAQVNAPGMMGGPSGETSQAEPVWTYRGYSLRSSEFTNAMVHMYRGEISRSNAWRQRLDATTNWAVVTTGATITIAFNLALGHHSVIFLNMLLVTLFLYIESRRYLYYELWSSRIRLMETDFFAAMLVPPFKPAPDWAEGLADNLLHPHFPISMWEGFGRRFRRNYMWIYIILALAWLIRVGVLPEPVSSLAEFLQRAAIGGIPGWTVMGAGFTLIGLLMMIGLATIGMHKTTGEVLPQFMNGTSEGVGATAPGVRAWFRHSSQRSKLMAHIVTDQAEAVAGRILRDMQRGVTSVKGTGMYSGAMHTVLLCALTNTEVNQLKKVVLMEDPKAFVIVSPVYEVLGNGFSPLTQGSEK
jgi:uncharacterized membrane protein